jgi:tetratricopeptide (TPR) repeat protein
VWAAQNQWDRIVQWNSTDGAAWKELAYQQPVAANAIPYLAEAVQHSPRQVYLREAYARALEQSSRPEDLTQARKEYAAAIELAPHRASNVQALGRLCYREKDIATALAWFKEARHLEPHYWESDLWIARSWMALGEKHQAIQVLRQLPARRNAFLRDHPELAIHASSPYEQMILAYDPLIVQQDLRRFQTSPRNSTIVR